MIKHTLMISFICLLPISTESQKISDIIKTFFTDGVHINNINLGENVGNISNLDLMFNNSYLDVTDEGMFGFNLFVNASEIKLTGEYDIIHLDLPGLFPLRGKGKMDALLKDTIIQINVTAKFTWYFTFEMEFQTFNITTNSSKVILENLFDDPDISNFISSIISTILPGALKVLSDVHSHYLEPLLQYFLNEIYRCIILSISNLEACLKNIKFPDYSMIQPFFHEMNIVYPTKLKKN